MRPQSVLCWAFYSQKKAYKKRYHPSLCAASSIVQHRHAEDSSDGQSERSAWSEEEGPWWSTGQEEADSQMATEEASVASKSKCRKIWIDNSGNKTSMAGGRWNWVAICCALFVEVPGRRSQLTYETPTSRTVTAMASIISRENVAVNVPYDFSTPQHEKHTYPYPLLPAWLIIAWRVVETEASALILTDKGIVFLGAQLISTF